MLLVNDGLSFLKSIHVFMQRYVSSRHLIVIVLSMVSFVNVKLKTLSIAEIKQVNVMIMNLSIVVLMSKR